MCEAKRGKIKGKNRSSVKRGQKRGKTGNLCHYFTVTYSATFAGTYSATLVSKWKARSSFVKEALKHVKNIQTGARGGLTARNTFSIFVLEDRQRH